MKNYIFATISMLLTAWNVARAQEIMIFDGKAIPVEQVDSITAGKTCGNVIGDQIWRNENLTIFAAALKATGIEDTLSCYLRDDYKETGREGELYYSYNFTGPYAPVPHHRYTVFIEPDFVYRDNGISSLEDLRAYAKKVYDEVFPEDSNVQDEKDSRNSLHRFVAYHILEYGAPLNQYAAGDGGSYKETTYSRAVQHVEHYPTLMPEALLKISRPFIAGKEEFYLNRQGVFDNSNGSEMLSQIQESDYGIHVDATSSAIPGNTWMNGYAYPIESILVYDKKTMTQRSAERLRFDMTTISPEMTANGLRLNRDFSCYFFPQGYFKNISWDGRGAKFIYLPNQSYSSGLGSWMNIYGDEMMLTGIGDITITLPVVPEGTYELRLGQMLNNNRGIVQFYIDDEPCGEPVDLTSVNMQEIGWLSSDKRTSDEVWQTSSEQMRKYGWMYSPHWLPLSNSSVTLDQYKYSLRRIIGTFKSDGKTAHTLRIQQTETRDTQTFLDYIEMCPECIYANPDKMEDKW